MADEKLLEADEEAIILNIPNNTKARVDFIIQERLRVIQTLALKSSKISTVPDMDTEPEKSLYQRLDLFLRWLNEDLQMTPEIKTETKIETGLKLICQTPKFHFPEHHKKMATDLLEKWEEENWGADEVPEDEAPNAAEEIEQPSEPPAKRRKSSSSSSKDDLPVAALRLPPKAHPIFGVDGIMHGVAYSKGQRKTMKLDPRYPKREAKVYGHNGLKVGAWFPMRMVALFHGAHGSTQAGISGNSQTGAYAIVVSGFYDDLDEDQGDVIYYSGSDSHDNTDPGSPPPSTHGTLALHASIDSDRPVRVLRASTGHGRYAPACGLRYDGLYEVVSFRNPKNLKGGMYEQFRLVRMEGQAPIDKMRPSPSEVRDFERISMGY